jgi:Predicted nucleoside-diphosphate sugar epimerase
MKIVIPGGSGQVGTVLARAMHSEGHDVVVLSRQPSARPWRVVGWDGATLGAWSTELDGSDVVINLTGRSVNCRYTPRNRQEILESRVMATRVLGEAISQASILLESGSRPAPRPSTLIATTRRTTRLRGRLAEMSWTRRVRGNSASR